MTPHSLRGENPVIARATQAEGSREHLVSPGLPGLPGGVGLPTRGVTLPTSHWPAWRAHFSSDDVRSWLESTIRHEIVLWPSAQACGSGYIQSRFIDAVSFERSATAAMLALQPRFALAPNAARPG